MDRRIVARIALRYGIDHRLRLLRRGRGVQIAPALRDRRQLGPAVDLLQGVGRGAAAHPSLSSASPLRVAHPCPPPLPASASALTTNSCVARNGGFVCQYV